MSLTYADLDALIGQFKQAAIDAHMSDCGYQIAGEKYVITPPPPPVAPGPGYMPAPTTMVSRPGIDGQGGGDSTTVQSGISVPGPSHSPDFDQIRSAIDALLDPWHGLPDPGAIEVVERACVNLVSRLAGTASFSQGHVSGVGIISSNLNQVHADSIALTGRTGEAFRADFLERIGAVAGGLWALSLLAATMVHVQTALWTQVRSKVVELIQQGAVAMSASCSAFSKQAEVNLEVVGLVVDVAKEFVPGLGGAMLGVAGIGIELLQDAVTQESDPVPLGGDTYQAVMASVVAAFNTLSSQVAEQERLVDATVTKNIGWVTQEGQTLRHPQPGSAPQTTNLWDLKVPPITTTKGVKITSFDLLEGIWRVCLPRIANELNDLAMASASCSTYEVVRREPSIGLGVTGPSYSFSSLMYLLYEMEKDLAWDVTNGGKELELVVAAFREHDHAAAQRLRDQGELLQGSSPYNPWDSPADEPRRGQPR